MAETLYDAIERDDLAQARRLLLAGGSDPVIKKDPGPDAWTHAVWNKATGK